MEPGVPHTFRNASGSATRVRNVHAPAMEFEGYFEGLSALATKGVLPPSGVTPKAALYFSTLLTRYPEEVRLVQPPYPVVWVMSLVARLLGYRV